MTSIDPPAPRAVAFSIPFLGGEGGLDESRSRMARALGWFNWLHVPVLGAIMLAIGGPVLWIVGLSVLLDADEREHVRRPRRQEGGRQLQRRRRRFGLEVRRQHPHARITFRPGPSCAVH